MTLHSLLVWRKRGIVVVYLSFWVCFVAATAYNFIWNGLETIEVDFGERAALCAWCAGQTASAEAAVLLRYLEQRWITVSEVAEIVEKNKSHQPLGDGPCICRPSNPIARPVTLPLDKWSFIQYEVQQAFLNFQLAVVVDQAQLPKFVHKNVHARPGRSNQ